MTTRLLAGCLLLLGTIALAPEASDAQVPDTTHTDSTSAQQGTMDLVGWPERDQVEAWADDLDDRWLPQFDRIQVDYAYTARDSVTDWQFTLAWSPGAWVHTGADGIQPLNEVDGPGRLEQLYVVANAVVEDSTRATALFAFDQMNVGPRPDSVELTWRDVPHEELFLELDAEAARALLAQNPTFEIVEVERVQALPPDRRSVASGERETREERRAPRTNEPRTRRSNTVFVIRTGYIFGRTWPRTVARPPSAEPATPADESTRGGRGSTTTADGDESDDDRPRRDDDDDDDDAPSLGPAAMGAAAVVGIAAVAGGSIGLSGSGDTPLGLSAGWTRPRGGVWLEAAINGAVLTDDSGQRFAAQLRGFTDIGGREVQPALGLGLRYEQEEGDLVSNAIVAPGFVWNRDPVAVSVSYDLVNTTPQFGLVFNLRSDAW
ncbi:hypothetical protein CRI93_00975 [Longimonas halophila]|uniref:Uncharacterized protein n=1 Tax=Longimonas halophila TaxID=1469170 RepID=A0A2H3NQ16_9BACT|nr:hypothetical protein [Longimonas halophila]PEN09333.1 hypothetical protein CRI93_00975 [Longimonas halophila]